MEMDRALAEAIHKLVNQRISSLPECFGRALRCHFAIGQDHHMVCNLKCFVDIVRYHHTGNAQAVV